MADDRLDKLCGKLEDIIGKSKGPKRALQLEAVEAFLALNDAHFDFKRSLDLVIPQQFLTEDGLSHFARWLSYKIMVKSDCDDGYLAHAIYDTLWNREKFPEFKGFHADTMNSMATTLNKYVAQCYKNKYHREVPAKKNMSISYRWIAKDFNIRGEAHYKKMMRTNPQNGLWRVWNRFARNAGCLGNFTLIPPNKINQARGEKAKDYWDCSLILFCQDLSSEDFVKYINTFFLWDYAGSFGGENFIPRPLFGKNKDEGRCDPKKWINGNYDGNTADLLPKSDQEFRDFLENANNRIERRSIFMTAMLKIAVCDSEDYENIIKYLMDLGTKQVIPVSLNQAVNELLKASENGQLPLKHSNSQKILKDTLRKLNRNPLKSRSRAALLFSAIPSGTSGSNP